LSSSILGAAGEAAGAAVFLFLSAKVEANLGPSFGEESGELNFWDTDFGDFQ